MTGGRTIDPNIQERVETLRHQMRERGLDGYIIPSTDPHRSEYLPECWQRRRFISGFTGSAGDVVITESVAGLWTDPRYHLQAEAQLDPAVFTLFKFGLPEVPTLQSWLAASLKSGQKVGVDPRLISIVDFEDYRKRLEPAGVELCSIDENLVDAVWSGRPGQPFAEVRVHDPAYAGETHTEKLEQLRERMNARNAHAHVITQLDAVAWLFNKIYSK